MVPEQNRQLSELMNLLARWFAVESAECLQEGIAPSAQPAQLMSATERATERRRAAPPARSG